MVSPLMNSHLPSWLRPHTFRPENRNGTHPSRIFALAGAAAMDSLVGEVWLCAGSETASAPRPGLPGGDSLLRSRLWSRRPL